MDQDRNERLDDLLDSILDASPEMVQALECPFCEGSLDLVFTSIQSPRRKTGKWLSLHVQCKNCGWKLIADGLQCQPPWIRKLGRKIQTATGVGNGRPPNKKSSVSRTKVPLK